MGLLYRLYNPEIFQGSLKSKRYFEGWYFKHVTKDLRHVYSFIPGISLNDRDAHAFIQMINGNTGETQYFRYNLSDFHFDKKRLDIRIGASHFTRTGITLDIHQNNHTISGQLQYEGLSPYPKTLFSPGIMGWYSFVPRMECRHGVVSANHRILGELRVNDAAVSFDNGNGYIEKDWGISFPKAWIWLQCNSFKRENLSVMVSIAHIPWMGSYFPGFLGFLYLDGQYHLFSTHNGSSIDHVRKTGDGVTIALRNKTMRLHIAVMQKQSGALKAPNQGVMSRFIKESLDSDIHVTLKNRAGEILIEDTGYRAGYEIVEEIFEYL